MSTSTTPDIELTVTELVEKEKGVRCLWDWAATNMELFEERRLAS